MIQNNIDFVYLKTKKDDDNDEKPIDVDEQEKMINEFYVQLKEHETNLYSMFTIIAKACIVLSFLVSVYVQNEERNDIVLLYSQNSTSSSSSLDKEQSFFILIIIGKICIRWIHTFISMYLHYNSNHIVTIIDDNTTTTTKNIQTTNNKKSLYWILYVPIGISLWIGSIGLYICNYYEKLNNNNNTNNLHYGSYLHYTLLLSNIIIIFAAYIIQWDNNISNESYMKFKNTKYHYKSL